MKQLQSILSRLGYVHVSELGKVQSELIDAKKTIETKECMLRECEEKLYQSVQDISDELRPLVHVNGHQGANGYHFGVTLSFDMLQEIYNQMFYGRDHSPAYEYFLRGIYHNIERDITALLRLKR